MNTHLVFGCGYLGRRVVERWRLAGHDVIVVTRSPEKAAELTSQDAGAGAIVADILKPATLGWLPQADTILFAVGFDRTAGQDISDVFVRGLKHVLDALPPPRRFVQISSTGVYGQDNGDWVGEESPCHPTRAGGQASLAAERALLASPIGARAIVLRMAGLYGPGRIPRADSIRRGDPIAAVEQGWLNLIHVDDAASIVVAAAERARPGTYNVSDGEPVLRGDYYRELSRLFAAPPPQFAVPAADSPRGQRSLSDKRVSNARLQAELGVSFAFPSYREGLRAIVAGGDDHEPNS